MTKVVLITSLFSAIYFTAASCFLVGIIYVTVSLMIIAHSLSRGEVGVIWFCWNVVGCNKRKNDFTVTCTKTRQLMRQWLNGTNSLLKYMNKNTFMDHRVYLAIVNFQGNSVALILCHDLTNICIEQYLIAILSMFLCVITIFFVLSMQ